MPTAAYLRQAASVGSDQAASCRQQSAIAALNLAEVAPQSILKGRTPRPSARTPAQKIQYRFSCDRRRLTTCCERRKESLHWQAQGHRISFYSLAEVIEYSTVIGHDVVPGDGTELAVALGSPTCQRVVPVVRKHAKPVDEVSWLTVQQRQFRLRESMGEASMARHCEEVAQVIEQRKESVGDSEEPQELMPVSYAQARDRALKVAAEACSARAHLDLQPAQSMVELPATPEKTSILFSKRKLPPSNADSGVANKEARLLLFAES